VSFLLMNNAMLLLRGPIMTLLVELMGVHSVLANLISLFAMTMLRYFLADKWIWNQRINQLHKRGKSIWLNQIFGIPTTLQHLK
jgi:putative flippase GtrA